MPDRHTLYSAQVLTQQLYPRFVAAIRELAGGALIMLPSSVKDFSDPEIAGLIELTQQSPAASAQEKVKFYKLAWDALGSEFVLAPSRNTRCSMPARPSSPAGAFVPHLRLEQRHRSRGRVLAGYDTGGEIGHDYENQS